MGKKSTDYLYDQGGTPKDTRGTKETGDGFLQKKGRLEKKKKKIPFVVTVYLRITVNLILYRNKHMG